MPASLGANTSVSIAASRVQPSQAAGRPSPGTATGSRSVPSMVRPRASTVNRIQAGPDTYIRQRQPELQPADGMQARAGDQVNVLPVALAPAQVALDEVRQRRRVLLEAAVLVGNGAHLPARAAHQRRLDLVVAEHPAAQRRPPGQQRQAGNGP